MRLLINTLGFVAVLIMVLIGTLFLLPADRLGRILSDQLTQQTGRAVCLGETRVTLWPVAGLAVQDLVIANADWAGDAPFFSARKAAFGLEPVAALQGNFIFRSIEADGPVLNLVKAADGRANWEFGAASGGTESASAPPILLNRLGITAGQFSYSEGGQTTRISDADLSLDWPQGNGPMQITARLTPASTPVSISGEITNPRSLLNGSTSRINLALSSSGGSAAFTGLLGLAPEAQGVLSFDLSDTARMLAALGLGPVDLPKGLGQAAKGSAQITLTRDSMLALREGELTLDGNALALAADLDLSGKPRLNARINAGKLDFSALAASDGAPTPTSGWSKAPIDASALGLMDGEVALVAEAVTLGGYEIGLTRALVTIDNSRAVFDLRELRAYEGLLTGEAVLNNRSGFSARADLDFAGVALGPPLQAAMGVGRLTGPADGSLSLLTSGGSLHELVAQVDGSVVLRAGPGRIDGIDLDQVLTGNVSGGTTIFDQAVTTIDIQNGVMRTSDMLMSLPRLQASGEGRVDLPPKTLDMLFSVLAPEARSGRGLSIPVRIKGPWSNPKIRVDAAEAINQNLAEEREALETKARERVNEAIGEKLGVTVEEGETLEDSLRKSLEDRAAKGLLDLLSR